MLEITTGVVFLMSSLYGSGQASSGDIALVAAAARAGEAITAAATTTIDESSFADTKTVEAYVRAEYADTPILIEIARCESTFRQYGKDGTVIRGRVNKADVGVMQINEAYHGEAADKMGLDIYSTAGNVAFGRYLYGKYGTKPWSSSAPCWSAKSAGDLAKK